MKMPLKLLLLFIASLSTTGALAVKIQINDKNLSRAQTNSFRLHLREAEKLLPGSLDRVDHFRIRFASMRSTDEYNTFGSYNALFNTITLNKELVPEYGISQELLRTFIHEIAHVYEDKVNRASQMKRFYYLAGWHKRGFVFTFKQRRNYLETRSPDPYEFSNLAESFAVNFEYFVMDPEYKCRRPLMYEFYREEFKFAPYPQQKCENSSKLLALNVDMTKEFIELDPERVFEIHYLLADEGKDVASRFGHSMLRLVVCAPHRRMRSIECLKDIEHHLVLSYRAAVTDLAINNIKGLLGMYPSQVYVLPMVQVIREYTENEFRNLISLPLKLFPGELRRAFQNIRQEAWAYQGKYRFVTQNCATETLDFLKVVVQSEGLYSQNPVSPRGVYDALIEEGLMDESRLHGEYARFHRFEQKRERYAKIYSQVEGLFQTADIDEYLEKTSALQRRAAFENFNNSKENKEELTTIAAAFYVLERLVLERHNQALMKKAFAKLGQLESIPQEIQHELEKIKNSSKLISSDQELGYGIPTHAELKSLIEENQSEPFIITPIKNWFVSYFESDVIETEMIGANIKSFETVILNSY